MPAEFVVNGDGTITIKYEYTAEAQKVQDTIIDAAAYEYHSGDPRIPWVEYPEGDVLEGERVAFDELSNQQKLNITYHRIKWLLLDEAKTAYITVAVEQERDESEDEADDRYIGEE